MLILNLIYLGYIYNFVLSTMDMDLLGEPNTETIVGMIGQLCNLICMD